MQPEHLVALMLVVPLAVMLFVAWGVRGPSRFTLLMWRLQAAADRVSRLMGERFLPIAKSTTTAITKLSDAAPRLSNFVDTGQMRSSMRPNGGGEDE